MNIPIVSFSMLSQHTVQHGGSNYVPFLLQCFSSIFTIGSLYTASLFAHLAFCLCWASYSLTLRIISKRSSDAKFWLKLLIKLSGLKSLYCVCILKKSLPLKTPMKSCKMPFTKFSMSAPIWPSFPEALVFLDRSLFVAPFPVQLASLEPVASPSPLF